MKKIFILSSILCATLLLAGCGEATSVSNSNSGSTPSSASISPDSSETSSIESTSTSVGLNAKEAFEKARANAVEARQFEYDFSLNAKLKYGDAISWSPADVSGTTYFNADAGETTYLQERTSSGLLLIDTTTYTYNVGTTYIKIEEDGKDFSVTDSETIDSGYNFEAKTFGALLNFLNADKLESVKETNGEFELTIKPASSKSVIGSIVKYIDCVKIVDAISSITEDKWGVGLSLSATAEIQNEKMVNFTFTFSITYSDFSIEFAYSQTYTKIGSGVSIVVPTFSNAITNKTDLTSAINTTKSALTASKQSDVSYYDYSLKTMVDHGISKGNPLGLAVNSTSAGKTIRKIQNNIVYFNNRLELDSDYKNNDQYPNDVSDYERYRARINDGENSVYDCEDVVGPFNNYTKLESYNNSAIDDYYMLLPDSFLSLDYINIGRIVTNNDGSKTYKFGVNAKSIKDLLNKYNDSIRLDVDLTKSINVYEIEKDFLAKKCNFEISVNSSGKVETINLYTKGFYFMTNFGQVKFDFDLTLDFDWSIKTYDIPTKYKDIVLS